MGRWLIVALVLTLAAAGASVATWLDVFGEMPARVPIHWGIKGQADGWVSREDMLPWLFLPPGIMVVMTLLALVLPWLSPAKFRIDDFRLTFDRGMLLVVALVGY